MKLNMNITKEAFEESATALASSKTQDQCQYVESGLVGESGSVYLVPMRKKDPIAVARARLVLLRALAEKLPDLPASPRSHEDEEAMRAMYERQLREMPRED